MAWGTAVTVVVGCDSVLLGVVVLEAVMAAEEMAIYSVSLSTKFPFTPSR